MDAINEYKASDSFNRAVEAEAYFKGENTSINNRPKWKMTKSGNEKTFSKNIAVSNFFFRFVVQQNQFLLVNGMQTEDQDAKSKLGFGFDKVLESIGEKALVHGVSWGFWNYDHLEQFVAVGDGGAKGFFVLLDEETSAPMIGIRYWQLDSKKPMHVQLFDVDGISKYKKNDKDSLVLSGKVPYISTQRTDAISSEVIATSNYGVLPVFPLYANEYQRSEFTGSIKTKIDLFDRIFSDFGDNLERTNDIYWVISNFGGSTDEIKEMLAEIEEIRATYSMADGSGNSTAMPHTVEVPYLARQTALGILRRELYSDYMAMDMEEISGGSLTNVAIQTAQANLVMKANRYEWQVFQFCQKLLAIVGIDTENITFRRQTIANEMEQMQMLVMCRGDFDLQTALEKNPMVEQDEVQTIMDRLAMEQLGIGEDVTVDDGTGDAVAQDTQTQ